jgi:hypothetical protein
MMKTSESTKLNSRVDIQEKEMRIKLYHYRKKWTAGEEMNNEYTKQPENI